MTKLFANFADRVLSNSYFGTYRDNPEMYRLIKRVKKELSIADLAKTALYAYDSDGYEKEVRQILRSRGIRCPVRELEPGNVESYGYRQVACLNSGMDVLYKKDDTHIFSFSEADSAPYAVFVIAPMETTP